jgi:uncharacterized protein YdaU (DUF1376 family)
MARKPDTWMPFYVGDYLRDTGRLTTEGHGAYLLLILDYWTSGGALPDDDDQLAAITKLTVARWKKLRPVVIRFFSVGGGLWRHKRIDLELLRACSITGKRSSAGKAGARARWQSHNNGMANDIANAMPEPVRLHWQNDAPSPSPVRKIPSKEGVT